MTTDQEASTGDQAVPRQVNIHEAKTHLSALLAEVEKGHEVTIARAGKPIAKLVPTEPKPRRKWLIDEMRRVPPHVRDAIGDPDQGVVVSSVSAMEVTTKVGIGTWEEARPLPPVWMERLDDIGAEDLQVTTRHGVLAGSLDWPHRDPFDRLLAAQALIGNLTLVTADKVLRTVPGLKLLTW